MRLICGLLQLDGACASRDLLDAMAAQMTVPRLRPSLNAWCDGRAGLAVVDFSKRDSPALPLPQTSAAIMAADVRLDEPAALARMLDRKSPQAEDALLLDALAAYGAGGLDRVLGDFAFASWNYNAHIMMCGRDVFGVRPFVYAYQPSRLFAFASLAKALYGSGIVAKSVDEDALVRRLTRSLRFDDSIIAGIKRLPPAHVIKVSAQEINITRYWQLDRAAVATKRCSAQEAAREARGHVAQAVRCRLGRAGETGTHLSGGLNSSAIAVLAARQLREHGRKLHAYSLLDRQRTDVRLEDETEFVKAVVQQESDVDWTPIGPPKGISSNIDLIDLGTMKRLGADEPQNAVCRRAEAQGVELILSGWAGDEAISFNGKGVLAELFWRGRWRALTREIRAVSRGRVSAHFRTFRGEVLSYFWAAWLPKSLVNLAQKVRGREPDLQTLLCRHLSAAACQRLAASSDEPPTMVGSGRDNRWRLITSAHIAERAEIEAEIGAQHGLAFAYPLLDRRVVEFALSLPSEFFLAGGFGRRLFRDAMEGVLPAVVRLRRSKYSSFPSRLIDLAASRDELLAKIDAYEKNEAVHRVIDLTYLRRQIAAFPTPEAVRDEFRRGGPPRSAAMMIAALQAVMAAAYLVQHGGG